MSDRRANPSFLNQGVSIVAILGCFLVFGLLLCLTYIPNKPEGFPVGSVPPEERAARLSELRAEESLMATGYSWIDQDKGVVSLPIDRAMELTRQELSGQSSE
ncbi:MAG: hypothetical protein DRP71_03035 [Verrucomicrobia bacterium]|nr:MAG: hypothetical protein DRP71_03035 [Verrucomicrobiota bacterium]